MCVEAPCACASMSTGAGAGATRPYLALRGTTGEFSGGVLTAPCYHLSPARAVPVRAVSECSEDRLRGQAHGTHRAYVEHTETHFTDSGTFSTLLSTFFFFFFSLNYVPFLL